MARCVFCGMDFCEDIQDDVIRHQKNHQRKVLAEEKFGHIAPYRERENLKDVAMIKGTDLYNIGGERITYYAHWCRSVEACNYDLKHPNLSEYIMLRKTNSDLLRGSYVNMKRYKEETLIKPCLICTKSGRVVIQIDETTNKYNLIYSTMYVEKGTRFEIVQDENNEYNDGLKVYEVKYKTKYSDTEILYTNPAKLTKSLYKGCFEAINASTNEIEHISLENFAEFVKIEN